MTRCLKKHITQLWWQTIIKEKINFFTFKTLICSEDSPSKNRLIYVCIIFFKFSIVTARIRIWVKIIMLHNLAPIPSYFHPLPESSNFIQIICSSMHLYLWHFFQLFQKSGVEILGIKKYIIITHEHHYMIRQFFQVTIFSI